MKCKSFYANIWIGGDAHVARQACRQFCETHNVCITITPTEFVYVGGMESGVCVRLMNYPRFPEEQHTLETLAWELAIHLRPALCQRSFSIEFPDVTHHDVIQNAR